MIDFNYGVSLSSIDPEHADLLRYWRNNLDIRKWCRQRGLISSIDQSNWIKRQNDDPSISMFVIKFDGERIGVCGLTDIDPFNRRAEFSLYIDPFEHGKGYGRAALKTLLSHGFLDIGLNVIWGETFEGNLALKMFQSIGFKKEGLRRDFYYKNGKFIDAHLVSITRNEWDKLYSHCPSLSA